MILSRLRSATLWVSFSVLTLASLPVHGQTPVARPTPLPSFGRTVASTDDTTAIVVNPANLAFLPGGELRWSSLYLTESALVPWQGHAFSFGVPLPFSAATGIRLDLVDPPASLAETTPIFRSNYQWLTWALAFRMGTLASAGFSVKHAYSELDSVDDITSWSFGVNSRPSDYLGLSFVAHELGSPESRSGNELGTSYDAALALRPLRSRALELGLEWKYISEEGGYAVPRAVLGVDIPELGRLRGDFSLSDPTEDVRERAWLASVVMSFQLNGISGTMEASGGSVFGDGLGPRARNEAQSNLAFEVAFKGFREPTGAEPPPYALTVRLEETPEARQHVALLRRLWYVAEREPRVAVVVLELRAAPAESMAHVQELRDAIHYLRQHGKQVLCHLEDATGSALYLCAAANRILINPAGGIRFAGLKANYLYYKGLLDKLGIRADFVRIGEHKSAPEAFTREGASEAARADKIDLLQQFEQMFTLGVAAGRRIDGRALRKIFERGPFIASEAVQAKLVDGVAFDDELGAKINQLFSADLMLVDDNRAPRAPEYFGATRGIALIYVDGDMVDGRSKTIPLLGNRLVGSYTIADALKQSRESPSIGAVVLRIETGGGSALAADVIWREVQITAQVKPVIVSMGSAAASGGYYIASPATRILANPLSITGSIGIFYGKADIAELLRRIGVSVESYRTAPRADAESIYRPYTEDERKELKRKVGQFYDVFLQRVAEGRHLTKSAVDAVGQGRVWTGEQAFRRKLVDELGGLRQALALARELADLPEHAPITELPPPDTTLLGRILGIEGVEEKQAPMLLPPELLDLAKALAPFAVHPADLPLARIEITPVGP